MRNQKLDFLSSEGDAYYERNKRAYSDPLLVKSDEILKVFRFLELKPKTVLEIGCANGFRLNALSNLYSATCCGIDPSQKAIKNGREEFPNISLTIGTADILPYEGNQFDVVIMGFCLSWCDTKDLFRIAYEGDRVLQDNGQLLIADFYPPFPFKNIYHHRDGLNTHKMRFADMFLWNPNYYLIYHNLWTRHEMALVSDPNERLSITVLGKDTNSAFPLNPFSA